jgi:hypothetical protein
MDYWLTIVSHHPWSYLKHRCAVWMHIIKGMSFKKLDTINFDDEQSLGEYAGLKKIAQYKLLLCLVMIVRHLLRFVFLIPFIIGYFLLGWYVLGKQQTALPLLMMNGLSLLLLSILFFFSMAGLLRYVYIIVCMVHACHPYAYITIKNLMSKSTR